MLAPRRFLPSLSLLTAFEAAARTGSITAAARELDLTQSAVSRQIKALEDQLGVPLFLRDRQTIRLTNAGDAYAREIREGLRRISTASLNLRANPAGGTLNIASVPGFGAGWLAPRLGGFLNAHPGIAINLVTRATPFDFRLEAIDAAIHFGQPHWQGAELSPLMEEKILPVCQPELKARHGLAVPADLLCAPLLHQTDRPDAWEKWLMAEQVAFDALRGMLFDQFAPAIEAAKAGLGVVLAPAFLVRQELARGELVMAIDTSARLTQSGEYYFLAIPAERQTFGPVRLFRNWLLNETESND
ncbi:LysR substrate-binding domain-containing protein [Allorhizobium undicola]|uniref:LysR substrate-binding domain-containing protein n=1 Tax=Allorhizobium undicola TaxID=78527 RepID=UPI0004847C13|nr:LysR substrate-binding domain-containing protein [Allorhizobium undicola]